MTSFDEIINRRGSNSYKYDLFPEDPDSMIPMPVADMDFRVAPPIYQKLNEIANHGIYGYAILPKNLKETVVNYIWEKYKWKIDPSWIVWMPSMEVGITNTAKLMTNSDRDILTVTPIYPPFHQAIANAGKKIYKTRLIEKNGRNTLNFSEIERSFSKNIGLFLLCNPHNPGGTVYTKAELEQLAALCVQYDVLLMSDEIHCELLLEKNAKHIPIASLNNGIMQNSITMLSPSKTYNIAGIGCAYSIIPNEHIRSRFEQQKAGMWPSISRMGYEATLTAYLYGEPWRQELLSYLRANHDYLLQEINQLPGLKMLALQATYLAWIDVRNCPIPNLHERLLAAGVRLIEGKHFLGDGYMRLNFACPKVVLVEAISRIKRVILE
jgi:cysteine-S-conjugate beta-lyase